MEQNEALRVSPPDSPYDFLSMITDDVGVGDSNAPGIYATVFLGLDNKDYSDFVKRMDTEIQGSPAQKTRFAMEIATSWWDKYATWGIEYTEADMERMKKIESGEEFGEFPGRVLKEGEEGYVGPIPVKLKNNVLGWLTEGDNAGLITKDEKDKLYARSESGDTLLTPEELDTIFEKGSREQA